MRFLHAPLHALYGNLKMLLLVVITISACNKSHVQTFTPAAMGHGGMGTHSLYPNNSLESLLKCVASGADGTDIDVQITKDSVLVLYHNKTLDRTTSVNGEICNTTWSELQYAYYTGYSYARYNLIRLKDALHALPLQSFTLSLDCKFKNENPDKAYLRWFARQIKACCTEYPLLQTCFVESVNPYFLNYLQDLSLNIKPVLYTRNFDGGVNTAIQYRYFGISMSNLEITNDNVKTAQHAGLYVMVWDVSSFKDHDNALQKQPNCIQSDRIQYLLKQIR